MGSQYKKLVPCIYLYKGNAVKIYPILRLLIRIR